MNSRSRLLSKVILGIVVLAVVVASFMGTILFTRAQRISQVNSAIEQGNKYLSELKYSNAIAAFKEAIGIDPKSSESLLLVSQTYIDWADSVANRSEALTDISKYGFEDYSEAITVIAEGQKYLTDEQVIQQNPSISDAQKMLNSANEEYQQLRLDWIQRITENALRDADRVVAVDNAMQRPDMYSDADYEQALNVIQSVIQVLRSIEAVKNEEVYVEANAVLAHKTEEYSTLRQKAIELRSLNDTELSETNGHSEHTGISVTMGEGFLEEAVMAEEPEDNEVLENTEDASEENRQTTDAPQVNSYDYVRPDWDEEVARSMAQNWADQNGFGFENYYHDVIPEPRFLTINGEKCYQFGVVSEWEFISMGAIFPEIYINVSEDGDIYPSVSQTEIEWR